MIELIKAGIDRDEAKEYLVKSAPDLVASFDKCLALSAAEETR